MYRQDDEPFTADFWSRIEVIEYNYAPEQVDRDYYQNLHKPPTKKYLTIQDLVKDYFNMAFAPKEPRSRAIFLSRQFLEFILLPKADENVKRANLRTHIQEYFEQESATTSNLSFSPEEATKIALRRLKDLQGYSAPEFFDLYDHFINQQNLNSRKLARLQTNDIEKYTQLKTIFFCLRYIEGCLRYLREKFYASAGQTEIEGTNREFIKSVYLLGLIGKI